MAKTFDFDPRDPAFYNPVINGNMDFWQRTTGTTRTQAANPFGRTADRHTGGFGGTTTARSAVFQRSAAVPTVIGGLQPTASLEIVNNTAAGALAANEFSSMFDHFIEGTIAQPLYGQPMTLGFWMFSSVALPSYSVAIRTLAFSYAYVTSLAVSVGWNYYTVQIPWSGTFSPSTDSNWGYSISLGGLAPSNQSAILNTWQAGNILGVTGATNWHATAGAIYRIAQVQLRSGSLSKDDMQYNYIRTGGNAAQELVLSQRYFEKSYAVDVAPATNTNFGLIFKGSLGDGSGQHYWSHEFRVTKRAIPTVFVYTEAGVGGAWISTAGNAAQSAYSYNQNATSHTVAVAATTGFYGYQFNFSNFGPSRHYGHFTADADF